MKEKEPSKRKFTFLYGNYVHGNGICIIAIDENEHFYDVVTVNLYPRKVLKADTNCIHIPNRIDPILYNQVKKELVIAELDTVPYGNFDSTAKLVRLKPNWKSHCKPMNE